MITKRAAKGSKEVGLSSLLPSAVTERLGHLPLGQHFQELTPTLVETLSDIQQEVDTLPSVTDHEN